MKINISDIDPDRISAKIRKLMEIDEEQALIGTIKFGLSRKSLDDEKGGRFTRTPNFAIPSAFPERTVSADGRVSFHFDHQPVVKRAIVVDKGQRMLVKHVLAVGKKIIATSAAQNDEYVSREGAVLSVTAADYEEYIEAGVDGASGGAVFTNIHPDPKRRKEFWDAVTRLEKTPSPDEITLYPQRLSADKWGQLLATFTGPVRLVAAFDRAQMTQECLTFAGPIKLLLDRAEADRLRFHMEDIGVWNKDSPAIVLKKGRGGRVQRRIVGELPHSLGNPARVRIARGFSAYLEKKGLMYTTAVHVPDHHNRKRNHHLHVAAYDRPCLWLEEHGCWDFEYREPVVGQHKRVRAARRQNKNASLTRSADGGDFRSHGATFYKEMRSVFADLCNEELRKAGIDRIYDPRTYAAMGILQKPQEHLGNKAAALDAVGVPVRRSIPNAEKGWQGAFDRAAREHETRLMRRANVLGEGRDALRLLRSAPDTPLAAQLEGLVRTMQTLTADVGDNELKMARLILTRDMAYSRPDRTVETCQRLLAAIEDGSASRDDRKQEKKIRRRMVEAAQRSNMVFDATQPDMEQSLAFHEWLQTKASNIEATIRDIREAFSVVQRLIASVKLTGEDVAVSAGQPVGRTTSSDEPISRIGERAPIENPANREASWDSVFSRIRELDLEIKPPTAATPVYHIPKIEKADLDLLRHPIFARRSQARLKAMHRVQEMRRDRSADLSAPEGSSHSTVRGQQAGQDSYVSETTQPDEGAARHEREKRLEALLSQQNARNEVMRQESLANWERRYRKEAGCVPVKFAGKEVFLDVSLLPDDLQQIADAFSDRVMPIIFKELEVIRSDVRDLLISSPQRVARSGNGFEYFPGLFTAELRPHLPLLMKADPVIRSYVSAALKARDLASGFTVEVAERPNVSIVEDLNRDVVVMPKVGAFHVDPPESLEGSEDESIEPEVEGLSVVEQAFARGGTGAGR